MKVSKILSQLKNALKGRETEKEKGRKKERNKGQKERKKGNTFMLGQILRFIFPSFTENPFFFFPKGSLHSSGALRVVKRSKIIILYSFCNLLKTSPMTLALVTLGLMAEYYSRRPGKKR